MANPNEEQLQKGFAAHPFALWCFYDSAMQAERNKATVTAQLPPRLHTYSFISSVSLAYHDIMWGQ
jgi:hypothetical protein